MTAAPVFLLVEPSSLLRFTLREWLQDMLTEYRLLFAASGDEAVRLAEQEQPTHVLIDIDLPDMSGIGVLQQICQTLPSAKVIATYWYESRFIIEKTRCAGASDFIPKHQLHFELLPLLKQAEA